FLLCTTVRNLLKHAPNDWRTLHGLSDPALADLLDEMRRYDAPLGAIERYAGDDRTDSRNHGITLGGVRVPKGCLIMGMLGSANRDDAVFGQDAGQLMVGRFAGRPDGSTARHLALGEGARDCIGTPLQHLTVPAALRALSRARPDLQLVSPQAEPPWIPNIYFRSFERLLVQ
ncbi:MAG: cytochrome P450, partial [Pseudomonadota bacterium]